MTNTVDNPRMRRLADTLAAGAHYGFPACCVMHYALVEWQRGPLTPQALERGVCTLPRHKRAADDSCGSYVPCGFHKKRSRCPR